MIERRPIYSVIRAPRDGQITTEIAQLLGDLLGGI
jgi:hypothetical protein